MPRAYLFWTDRWRSSSAYIDMTLEEQGAYRNLIDECCLRDGGIPNNQDVLARASGDPMRWPKVKSAVMKHFRLMDGLWRSPTLDSVMEHHRRHAERQQRYRDKQKKNGR
jgi:uncharacterized protein YdaU (DUF1376 family)